MTKVRDFTVNHIAMFMLYLGFCRGFDINDPQTNLDSLVRVSGSMDLRKSTIGYINGTVYARIPGSLAMKVFNFEGFNINRKILQKNGNYLSLSREITVYRDPMTSEILEVWINPLTSQPNTTVPASLDHIAFELNIDLSYPNILDPPTYPEFSAGAVYTTSELFTYFTNYTVLSTTQSDSVNYFGTWQRSGQFLPWMEMGVTPGLLFYNTFFWKCNRGNACIADDILAVLHSRGLQKFLIAPSVYEVPNETTWAVFKKVIDERRLAHVPDISIPMVNASGHPTVKLSVVDSKIISRLGRAGIIPFRFNGSVLSLVNGVQSNFYRLEGNGTARVSFNDSLHGTYMEIQLKYSGYYRSATSSKIIEKWTSPLTNRTVELPELVGSNVVPFYENDVYTNFIEDENSIGLIGATSTTGVQSSPEQLEEWCVIMPVLVFPVEETTSVPAFYGTWTTFSSYPSWMEMGSMEGHLKTKLIVSLQTERRSYL